MNKKIRLRASKGEKYTFLLPPEEVSYLGKLGEWIFNKEITLPVLTKTCRGPK